MPSITVSADMDERDARRLEAIAARENRSTSNVIATAALVFAALPKDVRDLLVEPVRDRIIEIRGVATSYYVKQVAQHIAMDVARLQRVINCIEVRSPR